MRIELPENVKRILDTLSDNGFEAYAVGGCVRDSILGRVPDDWDITTNALPEQVKALFRRTIDTGIMHGTVTIMIKEEGYEVTTYRVDGDYSDGRHPDSVEFSSSLEEDLKRRDFTINAMAYNEAHGLVDLFGGIQDIETKTIRCVGAARERFSEDALRLLRAVRFSAQLGFSIEESTAAAIQDLAPTIAKVSRERIHTELGKILLSKNPHYIGIARELGIMTYALPEYMEIAQSIPRNHGAKPSDFTEVEACLQQLGACTREAAGLGYRYAAMLYPIGEAKVRTAMKSLKLDNDTINTAAVLVRGYWQCDPSKDRITLRKQASPYGIAMYRLLERLAGMVYIQRTYLATSESEANFEKELADAWIHETTILSRIESDGDPLSIKELALTGDDLIMLGMSPGKMLGESLKKLLELVLEDPSKNSKETLTEIVTNWTACDTMR